MAQKAAQKSNAKKTPKPETNFNDVLIRLIDKSYNLLNSGNFIGLILAAMICFLFYIAHRCSDNFIETNLKTFLNSAHFPNISLIATISVSVSANFIQHRVYKTEIRRLTQIRKELMHGKEHGDIKLLKKHTSSNFNLLEEDI